jgi:hypothetical protein
LDANLVAQRGDFGEQARLSARNEFERNPSRARRLLVFGGLTNGYRTLHALESDSGAASTK